MNRTELKDTLGNLIDDWIAKFVYERSIGCHETGMTEIRDKIWSLFESHLDEEKKEKQELKAWLTGKI